MCCTHMEQHWSWTRYQWSLCPSVLLSRNEQNTNHKLYMWGDSLVGNLILVSITLVVAILPPATWENRATSHAACYNQRARFSTQCFASMCLLTITGMWNCLCIFLTGFSNLNTCMEVMLLICNFTSVEVSWTYLNIINSEKRFRTLPPLFCLLWNRTVSQMRYSSLQLWNKLVSYLLKWDSHSFL